MMDIEMLLKELRRAERYCLNDYSRMAGDAAAVLSTLQTENKKLRAELEQVRRERDAAQSLLAERIGVRGAEPITTAFGLPIDRLAAYEDTGLEPCDYYAMAHALKQAERAREDLTEMIRQIGATGLDRLRELALADREGRCVVLPCKVEDDVYINILGRTLPFTVISISQMSSTPTFKAQHGIRLVYIFKADDVGETVFMTRAEAALQGEREEKQ